MNWDYLSDIMKTLGHPMRMRIIAHLCEGDDNVGAMAHKLGLRPAAVSQQLSILRMREMVSKKSFDGRAVYTLEQPKLRELIECVTGCDRPSPPLTDDTYRDAGDGRLDFSPNSSRELQPGAKQ